MSATWKYIKGKLDDDSTIRGEVYAFEIPIKQKPPFVSFFMSDMDPLFTKDKETSVNIENWDFISSDTKVADAITNADNVRTVLDHTSGTKDGVTIKYSMMIGRSIPLAEEDEQGDKIFRVIDVYEFRV